MPAKRSESYEATPPALAMARAMGVDGHRLRVAGNTRSCSDQANKKRRVRDKWKKTAAVRTRRLLRSRRRRSGLRAPNDVAVLVILFDRAPAAQRQGPVRPRAVRRHHDALPVPSPKPAGRAGGRATFVPRFGVGRHLGAPLNLALGSPGRCLLWRTSLANALMILKLPNCETVSRT